MPSICLLEKPATGHQTAESHPLSFMEPPQPSDESKVLVIYTGGTIGMLAGQQGYVPEPYFLTETLRSQSRFHDPLQDSLFSNSASVQGFREWSNSGKCTPASDTPKSGSVLSHPTFLVRSSRPFGNTSTSIRLPQTHNLSADQPKSIKISDNLYEAHLTTLVTPRSYIPGAGTKRIRYAIHEVPTNLNIFTMAQFQRWTAVEPAIG
jgi:lysophospholipase